MKTTVEIPDPLLDKLRERAAKERTTLKDLFERAIRQFLAPRPRGAGKPFKLKDCSVGGSGLAPGIREGDWEQIRDIIYEGRGS